jgi:hypothetical protein
MCSLLGSEYKLSLFYSIFLTSALSFLEIAAAAAS